MFFLFLKLSAVVSLALANEWEGTCLELEHCDSKSYKMCISCEYCCWDGHSCWSWIKDENSPMDTCASEQAQYCKSIKGAKTNILPNREGEFPVSNRSIKFAVNPPYYIDGIDTVTCDTYTTDSYIVKSGKSQYNCNCGKWAPNPPIIIEGCHELRYFKNGKIISYTNEPIKTMPSLYKNATDAKLSCERGYFIRRSSTATCVNGTWIKKGSCIAGCPSYNTSSDKLKIVYHHYLGQFANDHFGNGTIVSLQCPKGMYSTNTATESSNLTCINAQWWGTEPKCKIGCPNLISSDVIPITFTPNLPYQSYGKMMFSKGTVAVKNCNITGMEVMKAKCKGGKWIGDPMKQCIPPLHCIASEDSAYQQCTLLPNNSCSSSVNPVFDLCDSCCKVMFSDHDTLCTELGCFCTSATFQVSGDIKCHGNVAKVHGIVAKVTRLVDSLISTATVSFQSIWTKETRRLITDTLGFSASVFMSEVDTMRLSFSPDFYIENGSHCYFERRNYEGFILVDFEAKFLPPASATSCALIKHKLPDYEKTGKLVALWPQLHNYINSSHFMAFTYNRGKLFMSLSNTFVTHRKQIGCKFDLNDQMELRVYETSKWEINTKRLWINEHLINTG